MDPLVVETGGVRGRGVEYSNQISIEDLSGRPLREMNRKLIVPDNASIGRNLLQGTDAPPNNHALRRLYNLHNRVPRLQMGSKRHH